MTIKCNVLLWIDSFTRKKKKAIKGIIKSIVKMDTHPQGPNRYAGFTSRSQSSLVNANGGGGSSKHTCPALFPPTALCPAHAPHPHPLTSPRPRGRDRCNAGQSAARPASQAPNLGSRRSGGEAPGPGLEVLKWRIFDRRDGVTGE